VFREWNLYASWGGDPDYMELYNTTYVKMQPFLTPAMAYAKPGDVFSAVLLVPIEEIKQSRFYKEWAEPQGICDMIASMLEKSATTMASVAVLRHERHGLADKASLDRMALLTPHYRRAVVIGRVLEMRAARADMLTETLDGLAAGVILVDSQGGLLTANAAGERMLHEGDLLHTVQGRVVAHDRGVDAALQDALSRAAAGDADLGARGLALPLAATSDGRWVAHILPLTAGTRREPDRHNGGAAALFVQRVALDRPPALEAIAAHYALTPTELRVLVAVVEIGGVPEAAPVLGIAESTVRSHLLSVFNKTGTSRQADLVKLVASFASPLA
jgi:DNA-binding CsgD family transcriptional regulator